MAPHSSSTCWVLSLLIDQSSWHSLSPCERAGSLWAPGNCMPSPQPDLLSFTVTTKKPLGAGFYKQARPPLCSQMMTFLLNCLNDCAKFTHGINVVLPHFHNVWFSPSFPDARRPWHRVPCVTSSSSSWTDQWYPLCNPVAVLSQTWANVLPSAPRGRNWAIENDHTRLQTHIVK